jgi:hypothetical protein
MRSSLIITAIIVTTNIACGAEQVYRPIIDGPWWQVAGNPDLGEYTREKQQPVDFGIWQASDGTWQLWSCIRHTGCGGNTRLFYRWQGDKITDTDWKPMGIAQKARTDLGETLGGQQAPHVVKQGNLYYMAYGDWVNICFSTSTDGKNFTRVIQPGGKTGVFSEGPGLNSRDPMLLKSGDLWYCYYTGHTDVHGYDFCRTTRELSSYRWSHSCVVAYGGRSGDYRWSAECPHVVELSPGSYYLFRTQRYGRNAQTSVYHSTNPLNFGIDNDKGFICTLPLAAPEIILHEGQYYVASLMPSLKGIHIAKLKWVEHNDKLGRAVFDFDNVDTRKWKGKKVFIRIIDKARTGWGHINFGGVYHTSVDQR